MIEVTKGCWINFDLVVKVDTGIYLTIQCVNKVWYFQDKDLVNTQDWWEGFLNGYNESR